MLRVYDVILWFAFLRGGVVNLSAKTRTRSLNICHEATALCARGSIVRDFDKNLTYTDEG